MFFFCFLSRCAEVPVGAPLEAGLRGAVPPGACAPAPAPAAPPVLKMTKKQSKQAQAQLDKLAKINIHLHGERPLCIRQV